MALLKKLLGKLNGLHYSREYLCIAKETFEQPLYVYLVNNKHIIKDITNHHLFVGYCPLIFALPSFADVELPNELHLIFSQKLLQPNEPFLKKDAIASLNLKIIKQQQGEGSTIFYYEGTKGSHSFLPMFSQWILSINNQLYNKRPGNVFLHNNLYKQVQVAYAIPRSIALITISSNTMFNLFPTDLHGQPDEANYIISLRTGGKALEQTEKSGRLLITKLHSDGYAMAYGLGKNHMQPLKAKDNFPFSPLLSQTFQWPLPQYVVAYKELALQDSFTHGIHKILLFKMVSDVQVQAGATTLAHIHNSYATWRYKNKLPGNYLR